MLTDHQALDQAGNMISTHLPFFHLSQAVHDKGVWHLLKQTVLSCLGIKICKL